jgi:hypothetical protein
MTRTSIERLNAAADTVNSTDLANTVDLIRERFNDEIDSIQMLYISPEKSSYHNRTDLLGEQFKANFPSANVEITEAGNCFAFDRFTACAFHLMRSLEVVLKSLFAALGLPPITSAGARNWNGVLREIRAKLDANRTIPDYDFYDSAYAFLAAAKNPMRNATMHVEVAYDEDSARRVFDAVGAFMRHISTKLKETP